MQLLDRSAVTANRAISSTRPRADDIFFPAMAVLILGVVVFGFAQSYFIPGLVFSKLPNKLVHIHAAFFVSWILLLLIQNALVALRRVRWHRALGILGLVLPPLMLVFGVLTLFDSIRRNGTGIPAEMILVGDLEELFLFVFLTGWGMLARRNSASHKRLMILGTMAMLGPAINRWPFPESLRIPGTIAVYAAIPLLVMAYDLWSRRNVHRSTAIACLLILAGIFTMLPVAGTALAHRLVEWILRG
jgi:hypothetical protein